MKRGKTVLFILLSTILSSIWCTSNEIKESWYRNSQSVENFKCKVPQARSFELSELFEQDDPLILHTENVYPSMTVLHRCENSGCCSSMMKHCAPTQTETVRLTFGIVEPGVSKIQYVHKNVVNHTSCACLMKNGS